MDYTKEEHITSTSAAKLTPQATQQKRIDPKSCSKYCIKEIRSQRKQLFIRFFES